MHEARAAAGLPHRRRPFELLSMWTVVLVAAGACLAGCAIPSVARLAPVSLGPAAPAPAAAAGEPRGAETGATADPAAPVSQGSWVTLSRAGRAAMRPGHYEEAERQFLAALEALDTQSSGDARIRALLGNLVRLAAIYRRLEREGDAERVLAAIGDRVDGREGARWGAAYDSRYRDLVGQPLPRTFSGVSPVSAGSRKRLDALIARTARSYRVDPALVKAVVAAESNFEPLAVSEAGAQGLMQLMPETAEEMGVLAPFRPGDNIRGGVRYLRKMLDRYGDLKQALAAYNAGPDAVDRYGGIPPYPETRDYVRRVLNFYRGYQGQATR